jgi:hypothetical protein
MVKLTLGPPQALHSIFALGMLAQKSAGETPQAHAPNVLRQATELSDKIWDARTSGALEMDVTECVTLARALEAGRERMQQGHELAAVSAFEADQKFLAEQPGVAAALKDQSGRMAAGR